MVKKKYNFELKSEEKIAKAFKSNARVSLKYSTELCREIKGKKVEKVEKLLQDIVEKKRFLPLRRYRLEMGHRKGKAVSKTKSGKYPIKLCKVWLDLLNSVKANADYKGLNSENLIILHCFASQGFRRRSHQKQGRIAGKSHLRKSAHIEVIVREVA